MELRNLYYFVQVCEDRSFSIASNHLFITQQALSKSIKSLENELGNSLFTKTSTGMILTSYAEAMYPICKDMLSHYEAGLHKIRAISKEGEVPIRLAISYQTVDAISFTLLDDYKKRYPDVKIIPDAMPDLLAEKSILEGKADFVFTVRKPIEKERFHSFLIKKIPLCIMVGPDHPLYKKSSVSINDLDQMDLHCAGPQFKTYHLLKEKAEKAGVSPNLIPTSGHLYSTYKNIFENNRMIIGLLGEDSEPHFEQVRCIPFDDPDLNWDIYLNYLNDSKLTLQEENFLNTVLSYRKKII